MMDGRFDPPFADLFATSRAADPAQRGPRQIGPALLLGAVMLALFACLAGAA